MKAVSKVIAMVSKFSLQVSKEELPPEALFWFVLVSINSLNSSSLPLQGNNRSTCHSLDHA